MKWKQLGFRVQGVGFWVQGFRVKGTQTRAVEQVSPQKIYPKLKP